MRVPPRRIAPWIVVFSALCLVVFLFQVYREQPRSVDGRTEDLRLGIYRYTTSALLLIAEDQGLFARKGLDVSNKHYEYGVLAIKDLLSGNIDIAAATDSVAAWSILRGYDLKILAAVASADLLRLVGRTDRGIRHWSDLKGKKVGLTKGTVSEFFFDRALTFNKLTRDDVDLIHLDSPAIVDSITKGEVDAVVVWSPLDEQAQQGLEHKAVSWSVQYGQDYYWVLLCKSELLQQRPQAIERLFAALALAEDLMASNQAEAQQIVARQQAGSQGPVDKMWPYHKLRVSLDQQMLVAMEDAARWHILRGYSKGKTPNFLNFIYFDGLEAAKPGTVSIVH